MRKFALAVAGLCLASAPALAGVDKAAVVATYGDIARAMYEDSLATAKELDTAIDAFLAEPSAARLEAAKAAWIAARRPYQQTEVYRFGNAIVDDWEGKVNAWPLDEGLIDYVDAGYGADSDDNPLYTANVLANENAVLAAAAEHPGIRAVALELSRLTATSVTVLDTLADLDRELASTGVELRLAAVPEEGAGVARRTSWFAGLEAEARVYPTLDEAVRAPAPPTSPTA